MLSDLQARVARIVATLPAARGFALAGGAALVVHGLTDRATNDLDFFTTSPDDIDALRQAIETALADAGMTAGAVISTETFVRLEIGDGAGATYVDLAWDARMRPAVVTDLGPVLHEDELAADKVLALFGRGEARDFLDVFGLFQRLGWERLLDLAEQKDAGFSGERLAESLGRIDRLDQAEFGVDAAGYEALRSWVNQTRVALGRHPPSKRPGRRR